MCVCVCVCIVWMCLCVQHLYACVLRGHFDKWPVYGAVTLRTSMGKYFPTSAYVFLCLFLRVFMCVERGAMLWSSDCTPVVWCMINQTDWMGQIFCNGSKKRKKRKRERVRVRKGLLCCMWRCVHGGVDVCTRVLGFVCKDAEVCMKGTEVRLRCVWGSGVE